MTALIIVLFLNYLSDQVGIGYFSLQAANSNGYTVQYFPFWTCIKIPLVFSFWPSAPNLIPAGASSWESTQGQDFSITFDTEGVYVYQCTPHLVMAMVGLIQVGEATNMAEIKSNLGGFEALIALNQDRLGKYFSQLESL